MLPRFLSAAGLGIGLLAVATAAPPAVPTAPPDNPVRSATTPDGVNAYEGVYVVESGEEDGKPVPKEKFDGSKVTITPDAITGTAKGGKKFFAATYTVNAAKTPAHWVLRPNGWDQARPVYALVERDGPTLKIVYNVPDGPKPTGFKTVKGQHLFVLRLATEAGVPPAEKK